MESAISGSVSLVVLTVPAHHWQFYGQAVLIRTGAGGPSSRAGAASQTIRAWHRTRCTLASGHGSPGAGRRGAGTKADRRVVHLGFKPRLGHTSSNTWSSLRRPAKV